MVNFPLFTTLKQKRAVSGRLQRLGIGRTSVGPLPRLDRTATISPSIRPRSLAGRQTRSTNFLLTYTATVPLTPATRAVIGVGRVKTPTTAIVCLRELEICDFVVEPYFEVVATATIADGQFWMRHAAKERVADRVPAETIAALATGPLAVKVDEKRQLPTRLHDLPSLQKLCASRFGWSADRMLAKAQKLYDGSGKKNITSPRAETCYLPESLMLARDCVIFIAEQSRLG